MAGSMIINKAQVSAAGPNYSGKVTLTLTEKKEGWTYEIDQVRGDAFTFTWRAATPEKATSKLQDLYRGDTWNFEILDRGE